MAEAQRGERLQPPDLLQTARHRLMCVRRQPYPTTNPHKGIKIDKSNRFTLNKNKESGLIMFSVELDLFAADQCEVESLPTKSRLELPDRRTPRWTCTQLHL